MMLLAAVSSNSGTAPTSVTDSLSGTWTAALGHATSGTAVEVYVFASYQRASGITLTVTSHFGSSVTSAIVVAEVPNVMASPLDAVGTATTGSSTVASSAVTTTVANDYVVLAAAWLGNTNLYTSGGYLLSSASSSTQSAILQGGTLVTAGTITPQANFSNSNTWAALSIAFKIDTKGSAAFGSNTIKACASGTTCTTSAISVSAYSSIVVGVGANSGTAPSAITDSAGHTYATKGSKANGATVEIYVYLTDNVSASASLTVTVNFSSATVYTINVIELLYSTTSSFDSIGPGSAATGTLVNDAKVTQVAADVLLILFGAQAAAMTASMSTGAQSTGFMIFDQVSGTSSQATAWQIFAKGANTANPRYTSTLSGAYAAIDIAFKSSSAPAAPTGLSAGTTTSSTVPLTWTGATGPNVNSTVYRYDSACSVLQATYSAGAVHSYTVTGLASSTTYCFKVTQWNTSGESPQSSSTSATTQTSIPSAPTGLTVSSVTVTSISLTWSNPTGTLVNDTMYRWTGSSCSGSVTGTSLGVVTSATQSSLSGATTYSFEVSAWSSGGESPKSSCVSGTTLAAGPTGLTIGTITTTSVALSWSNPSGTLVNDTAYSQVACAGSWTGHSTSGAAASFTVSGLTSGTKYCFRVTAWSAGGESVASAVVNTTTLALAPTALAVTSVTLTTITLSWINPSGALVNDTVYTAAASCSGTWTGHSTAGAATSYTATGLNSATTYCFRVTAWTSGGESAPSTTTTGTTHPDAVTALVITSVTAGVNVGLAWANPSGTIVNDTIHWGTTCGALTHLVSTAGAATSFTVSALPNGTTEWFEITAWSSGGQGNASTCVSDAPSTPINLAGSQGATTVSLNWTNTAAGIFSVSADFGSTCAALGSTQTGPGPDHLLVTSLAPSTTYCFAVRVSGYGGSSNDSLPLRVTTLASTQSSGSPSGLKVNATGATYVNLSWSNPAGTTNDTIWFGSDCSHSNRALSTGGAKSAYTVSGLASTTTYCFSVQSYVLSSPSNFSAPAIATTLSSSVNGGAGNGGGNGGNPGGGFLPSGPQPVGVSLITIGEVVLVLFMIVVIAVAASSRPRSVRNDEKKRPRRRGERGYFE